MTEPISKSTKLFKHQGEQTKSLLIGAAFPSQVSAAKELHVSRAHLSRVLGGERPLSEDLIETWERVLGELAESGSACDPSFTFESGQLRAIWSEPEPPEVDSKPSPHAQTPGPAPVVGRRRRYVLAAASLVLVMALIFVYREFVSPSDSSTAATSSTSPADGQTAACPVHFVDFVDGFEANFEPSDSVMVGAVVRSRSFFNWPCPTGLGRADFGGDLVVTPLLDRDGRPSFLVSSSPTEAMVLTAAQWFSVDQARQWAESFGGPKPLPKRYEPASAGSAIVAPDGWRLVAAERDRRHVYLPPAVYGGWLSNGREVGQLGFPVSNGHLIGSDLRFDFAGGNLLVSADEVNNPDAPVSLIADKTLGLPAPQRRPDLIVIQDGSAWLRDGATRQWVPNPELRTCLASRHGEPVAGAGTALARLEDQGIAECEANN